MPSELQRLDDGNAVRCAVSDWRRAGLRIGFVPTMGNLHAGHYSLIAAARAQCDRVVASIFVNPTQFGPNEDFASYPRTMEADAAGLVAAGCDLLFAPAAEVLYPFGLDASVRVHVPLVSEGLCGAFRPGHFDGVATVVAKLFHWVQPDIAFFGRKDFQQLRVIERMVRDLGLPIAIVGVETLREPNGLAMSSRNQYLATEERERAAEIYRTLQAMRDAIGQGRARAAVEAAAVDRLDAVGFRVDYAAVRRAEDLSEPAEGDRGNLVALIAARLGKARLIDNIMI
ncbi:MAG: pantoate--beta-alanine ligase [Rhodanobacteraceae bacterium]|nr:pantoate--beta-alanine ligase [Rhodanobacteraceae bacterium]MBP6077972.1 pantoate--beta-alanine ligase [Xanthomonadales bacterium]MBP7624327.1 pantoate--beta-alanine ligase [Xanthomonadales bacterium]